MPRRRATAVIALLLVGGACSDAENARDDSFATPSSSDSSPRSQRSTASTPITAPESTAASTITVGSIDSGATSSTTTQAGVGTTAANGFLPVPDRPPPNEPVTVEPASAGALDAVQTCDPDAPATPAVVLTWRSMTDGRQLVAVATLPDGFDTDRYTVSNELPAGQSSYRISPIEPGGIYRWRVLTWNGSSWSASETGTFTGPTCVLDSPSSP